MEARLIAALMLVVGLSVAGQLAAALLIDRFGWLERHSIL
jgi:uncharacterized membrane protein YdcZ (DUF606 family)